MSPCIPTATASHTASEICIPGSGVPVVDGYALSHEVLPSGRAARKYMCIYCWDEAVRESRLRAVCLSAWREQASEAWRVISTRDLGRECSLYVDGWSVGGSISPPSQCISPPPGVLFFATSLLLRFFLSAVLPITLSPAS